MTGMATTSTQAPLLVIEAVSKRFPGVQALRDVSLVVNEAEVHALVGQNGAGKSTLVRCVSGVYAPDAGRIVLGGVEIKAYSPVRAYALGIAANWDTGNAYLAGAEDPYEALERVIERVHHVHAKDISLEDSERERGKVTGTPVGCACGEGVVDWERILHLLDPLDREVTLSVECGTIDEAQRSRSYLTGLIEGRR
jgi:ABC-type uncharacterized transport system ATPase subunit